MSPALPPETSAVWSEKYICTHDACRIWARDADGRPYCAKTSAGVLLYPRLALKAGYDTGPDGDVLFPRDDDGGERYLREGSDDVTDGLHRYARDARGKELYPIKTIFSNFTKRFENPYEALIDNRYALMEDGQTYYYPLDCFGNEYYISWTDPSLKEEDVILGGRYAISNMGFFILPKKNGDKYVSVAIGLPIPDENVQPLEIVERGFGKLQDYLTCVPSHTVPRKLRSLPATYDDPPEESTDDDPESTDDDLSEESTDDPSPASTVLSLDTSQSQSPPLRFYQSWTFWAMLVTTLVKIVLVFFYIRSRNITLWTLLKSK